MKHIFLNLKRFDVPPGYGGVNRIAPIEDWGASIVRTTQEALKEYDPEKVKFVHFFPEAHILGAIAACRGNSPLMIGCQSVYRMDTNPGGNFGAFTSNRTASSMAAMGCRAAIIGHCEERSDKNGILREAGVTDTAAVNRLLNQEIHQAVGQDMDVLYCIGEKAEEQEHWQDVLGEQLRVGLSGVDTNKVVVAYEPVWSIGPGKLPADREYITKIAGFVKDRTGGLDVVYGGGLKADNAEMLSDIPDIDGGLIALTRFAGEIGFYPEEYIKIVHLYLGRVAKKMDLVLSPARFY